MIARHPIIQDGHANVAEKTLEKSGPRKKRPQVNADNTVLIHLLKSVFGKTSWRTHARSTEKTKPERLAIRLLSQNLECNNFMDDLNSQNKAAILCLRYGSDNRAWGIVVTEGAEYNILIAATVALNASRVSRTI